MKAKQSLRRSELDSEYHSAWIPKYLREVFFAHLMNSTNQEAVLKLEIPYKAKPHHYLVTNKKGVTVSTVTP